ncbi:MAG TPA: response regulator [Labilithrix sp.]|nr:response regulator [Labilithrix sp.]
MSAAGKRRVLVLDDDVDFCDLMAMLLESTADIECLGVHRFAELCARAPDVLGCELAILDVNLGPGEPSGLDALAWLQAHGFMGAIVFLTGHARWHPFLRQQAESSGVRVLEKPVDAVTLLSLLSPSSNAPSTKSGDAR